MQGLNNGIEKEKENKVEIGGCYISLILLKDIGRESVVWFSQLVFW